MKTRHAFVAAHEGEYSTRVLCRVAGLARSSVLRRRARPERDRQESGGRGVRQRRLLKAIRRIFKASRRTYGAPRIHAELRGEGWKISRKTVAKIMKEHNISPPRRKRRAPMTTDSNHDGPIAPNLLARNFKAARPNQAWLADITYVRTDEGWLYVAAVKDMMTREIVGWAMDESLHSELCERALTMAIQRHNPPKGLIHHSDRGSQYASEAYRKILRRHGLTASMSRKGNCWDNAPMESFFGSLKSELVHRERFATRAQARRAIFDYIEVWYNRRRRHSSIGYIAPEQARRNWEQNAKTAA
jgi:transposase InsO family protein